MATSWVLPADGKTTTSLGPILPSLSAEAWAFWRLRCQRTIWALRRVLQESRLRLALVLLLSGVLWGVIFWLCWDGFRFLRSAVGHAPTHDQIVHHVFGMYLLALMLMLMISCGILLYGMLFRGPDISLLLTLPVSAQRVFLHKFQEAVWLSSWAFVLLSSPMFVAYGLVAHSPWYYYAVLVPFLISFSYIPAAIGAMACLVVVRWFPGARMLFLVGVILVLVAGGAWLVRGLSSTEPGDLLTPHWFQSMLHRLRFSQHRMLPSWWVSMGILEAAQPKQPAPWASRPPWAESLLFLTVTISNALLFRQIAAGVGQRWYRTAYSRLHTQQHASDQELRRRFWLTGVVRFLRQWSHWASQNVDRLLVHLPMGSQTIRLLVVKDFRLFRRDPVQWSQFLVFFGLVLFYFLHMRPFSYDIHHATWVNMVSFLNLSVVGLLLSTFTTRFVFPTISLEGRRFWLLGLLPLRREQILWSKFIYAFGSSVFPCSLLVLLSDWKLGISPLIIGIHQLTAGLLAMGLSGISVGLGAKMPNFQETSPARIAAGFGGTLCLVLSALYIVLIVAMTALPSHFWLALQTGQATWSSGPFGLWETNIRFWMFLGIGCSLLLGLTATAVPMYLGFRAFRRMEF
ncbi:MAG: hypothetical protein NZ602_16575 [Thermoguttaceae bacterium]|nr:hypothetical protein [Thermoguttaceae bacterium]MDW8038680.1 hypothetical protein [Thermoguttaceae bacterium]